MEDVFSQWGSRPSLAACFPLPPESEGKKNENEACFLIVHDVSRGGGNIYAGKGGGGGGYKMHHDWLQNHTDVAAMLWKKVVVCCGNAMKRRRARMV